MRIRVRVRECNCLGLGLDVGLDEISRNGQRDWFRARAMVKGRGARGTGTIRQNYVVDESTVKAVLKFLLSFNRPPRKERTAHHALPHLRHAPRRALLDPKTPIQLLLNERIKTTVLIHLQTQLRRTASCGGDPVTSQHTSTRTSQRSWPHCVLTRSSLADLVPNWAQIRPHELDS